MEAFLLTSPPRTGSLWTSVGRGVRKDLRASLMALENEPLVGLLEDRDCRRAAKGHDDAFANDPLFEYNRAGEKLTPGIHRRIQTVLRLALHGWIRSRVAITVEHGTSVVIAQLSEDSVPRGSKQKAIDWAVNTMFKSMQMFRNAEQKKRQREYRDQMDQLVAEKIGDRANSMISVNLVFTAPEGQGHGYASALLRKITDIADLFGEACWLISSNIANEGFYNSHGFFAVGEVAMGKDNPDWEKKPVVVQLMVREPKV